MHQLLSKGHQESGGYREELQQNHPGDIGWEARERFLTDAPRALGPNGVTSQEQAGGREEDHQPTLGEAVGQGKDLCQEGW